MDENQSCPDSLSMKDARNVGQKTTSPVMTMDQHGVSGATTMRSVLHSYSTPHLFDISIQEQINILQQFYRAARRNTVNGDLNTVCNMGFQFPTYLNMERNGTQEPSPSASSTVTKKELSAVFKDVPFQQIDKPVNITTGEQPRRNRH